MIMCEIWNILVNYEYPEVEIYEENAIVEVVGFLSDSNIKYLYTDIAKDDMTGGTIVLSFIDEDNRLRMTEWEYKKVV